MVSTGTFPPQKKALSMGITHGTWGGIWWYLQDTWAATTQQQDQVCNTTNSCRRLFVLDKPSDPSWYSHWYCSHHGIWDHWCMVTLSRCNLWWSHHQLLPVVLWIVPVKWYSLGQMSTNADTEQLEKVPLDPGKQFFLFSLVSIMPFIFTFQRNNFHFGNYPKQQYFIFLNKGSEFALGVEGYKRMKQDKKSKKVGSLLILRIRLPA